MKTAATAPEPLFAACIGCRACLDACPLLEELDRTPADIARALESGQRDGRLVEAVRRCALCGLCSRSCPLGLNPADLMQTARTMLLADGVTDLDDYRLMLVDHDWHFFTLYRRTWGIDYADLATESYQALFFPGCTLASYGPALTRTVHAWLRAQGLRVGISAECCGLPLLNIGLPQRSERMLERLKRKLREAGARQLITACPNCYYHFRAHLADVEVVPLYQLLADAGLRVPGRASVTVHDACPDRFSGRIGALVRQLLAGHALAEMDHHGPDAVCCGAGGIVSMVDPALCGARARSRIAEFHATGAQYCVTACMSCSKRLEAADTAAACPGKDAAAGGVVHLLELIFDTAVDQHQVKERISQMWQGAPGDRNLRLLAGAQPLSQSEERHV